MEVKSEAKWIRISARKVRRVMDVVRGKGATQAMVELGVIPSKAAKIVKQVLKSAIANAVNNYKLKEDE